MASSSLRFYITQNDAPQSVGLLWTSDQLIADASTEVEPNQRNLAEGEDMNLIQGMEEGLDGRR
jgi:hypothetical protein